ncbi:organic cation/carnitine transporter 3-like [Amaranthus tricolor]|uniref:organic cation/carnitine transporter 3-like n=1 Tax=Amaranthus tricolor TaxID=29722 RepID=UPI002589BA16|nr:organic cation/carnitine transporter 3-like [Amaranthus tricolor]
MANSSSPLLTNHNDEENTNPYNFCHSPRNKNTSVNDKIEQCIENLGWAQIVQCLLVSLAWAFDAQQAFISIFTDTEPSWHCTTGSCGDDICSLKGQTWAWDAPLETSIISEWGLQCVSSLITGLPASSFFIGCVIGGLVLATLADTWLGRKNLLILCTLAMSLSGIFTALFSSNIWIYAFLRFVSGFGRAAIGTCSLVLATEVVGKQWRGQIGVIGFFFFSFGFLSLPGIAYLNQGHSWRNMYIWTSAPALIYSVLVFIFVKESPRWLLIRGRREEAMDALKNFATLHQSSLTLSFFGEEETSCGNDINVFSAMKNMVSRAWALRRLITVSFISIGIGMIYYGMPLALGNLPMNLYLSVSLNALSELPGLFLTFVLVDRLSRRSAIIGFTLVSGISSIFVVGAGHFAKNNEYIMFLQIGFEMLSFLCGVSALNLMLIFTCELFPTCVRNSALSMARQALVFGGAFAPPLVAAGRNIPFIAYGVFGVVIGVCGSFAIFLPETRGTTLTDTLEEEEFQAQRLGSFWATH